jgi:hypothetical protein
VIRIAIGLYLLILFSGCAKSISQSNLYWGSYSETLYAVKSNPGDASNSAHEQELHSILKICREMNLRVPPGVYAELGVFAKQRGDDNSAHKYFRLELNTYPEGAILMNRLLQAKPSDS